MTVIWIDGALCVPTLAPRINSTGEWTLSPAHTVCLVCDALSLRNRARIFCGLAILSSIASRANRPKVLGCLLSAFRVPLYVISAPCPRFAPDLNRAFADVACQALAAKQVEPCVRVNACAACLVAVALHNGTCANVSTFPAFRSRIGGIMSAPFNPVSASITSATASNRAQADRCGSVLKSMLSLVKR